MEHCQKQIIFYIVFWISCSYCIKASPIITTPLSYQQQPIEKTSTKNVNDSQLQAEVAINEVQKLLGDDPSLPRLTR